MNLLILSVRESTESDVFIRQIQTSIFDFRAKGDKVHGEETPVELVVFLCP